MQFMWAELQSTTLTVEGIYVFEPAALRRRLEEELQGAEI